MVISDAIQSSPLFALSSSFSPMNTHTGNAQSLFQLKTAPLLQHRTLLLSVIAHVQLTSQSLWENLQSFAVECLSLLQTSHSPSIGVTATTVSSVLLAT